MYRHRFYEIRDCWRRYDGDLVRGFRALQDAGRLEIITCTATHPFFPLLDRNWAAFRAQVHTAASVYERLFGRRSQGMWLGECGYVPGVDELLREEGIRYFFVDTHGVLFADPRPLYGVHAPVYCRSGVAAFGRDIESSKQVWSAQEGYPGDPHYRDFYRDIGFDLPLDYIKPYIHPAGIRTFTGIKYHAITHRSMDDKRLYDPHQSRTCARPSTRATSCSTARSRSSTCARTWTAARSSSRRTTPSSSGTGGTRGRCSSSSSSASSSSTRAPSRRSRRAATCAEYPTNQVATPSLSSWGEKGYGDYWCNGTNAWVYRHLHKMAERMIELARRFPDADGLERRALDQAAREVMLAQSSDWAFIMKTGTTVPYATKRTNEHVKRFTRIYEGLVGAARSTRRGSRKSSGGTTCFPRSTTGSTGRERGLARLERDPRGHTGCTPRAHADRQRRQFFGALAARGQEPRLGNATGTWQFDVEGAGTWTVRVDQGALSVASGQPSGSPTARLNLSEAELVRLADLEVTRIPSPVCCAAPSGSTETSGSPSDSWRSCPYPTTGRKPDEHQQHLDSRRQHVRRQRSAR